MRPRRSQQKIADVRELDCGYELGFAPEAGIVEELGRFIGFERVCCAFLDFSLRVEAGQGPVRLAMTGTAEAKSSLRSAIEQWQA